MEPVVRPRPPILRMKNVAFAGISARGKFILSRALAKLETDPPEVPALPSSEMCDPAVYHKTVGDTIVEEMRKRGYKVIFSHTRCPIRS